MSGILECFLEPIGRPVHSAIEVSQDASEVPAIGFDGFGVGIANCDSLSSHEIADPGCADNGDRWEMRSLWRPNWVIWAARED